MIVGLGSDIVQIDRVGSIYEKYGERFHKYFSDSELECMQLKATYRARICYLAKRFAAKEAFVKALGTGFRYGIEFSQISAINDDLGKPYIKLSGNAKSIFDEKCCGAQIHLSISDDYPIAQATVIIDKA